MKQAKIDHFIFAKLFQTRKKQFHSYESNFFIDCKNAQKAVI